MLMTKTTLKQLYFEINQKRHFLIKYQTKLLNLNLGTQQYLHNRLTVVAGAAAGKWQGISW